MSVVLIFGAAKEVHPVLAVNDPVSGGALVVEGWVPDYGFEEVIAEFRRNQYSKLYVTGGALEHGVPLSEYRTYAERGAAIVIRMGLEADVVQAVPAPSVRQDRTYASAVALRNWLREHGVAPKSYHVISFSLHARRTRLLFEKALGEAAKVGITAIENREYDPNRWWKTSAGVRTVIGEMVAYVYARLLFWPSPQ